MEVKCYTKHRWMKSLNDISYHITYVGPIGNTRAILILNLHKAKMQSGLISEKPDKDCRRQTKPITYDITVKACS
jgi:hypothetical protein